MSPPQEDRGSRWTGERLFRLAWVLVVSYLVIRGLADLADNTSSFIFTVVFLVAFLGGCYLLIESDQRREREKRRSEGRF